MEFIDLVGIIKQDMMMEVVVGVVINLSLGKNTK